MSEGYVKQLLDPLQTLHLLRRVPIFCGDLLKTRLTATNRVNGNNAQAYNHVPAANRISYFDLRVVHEDSERLELKIENQEISTQFKSGILIKTAKRLRPCYYLPYLLNGVTRMKLSPPQGYTGDPIEFFATAAIDGCSVYVEGPAATPKVSHANANAVAPAPLMRTQQLAELEHVRLGRVQAKITDMDNRMNIIKKGQATVVDRPHYMSADTALGRAGAMQAFANAHGFRLDQVVEYIPMGAVIGVMTNGQWKFFLQKFGSFGYYSNKPTPQSPPKGYKSTYYVLAANEFWPANSAGARIF
jgi:hypothetical protein